MTLKTFLLIHPLMPVAAILMICLILLGIYDVFIQKKHAITHNFPVLGHLRFLFELIGPELRQYWISNDKEELPFNRDERSWIYATSKGSNNYFGFGTTEQVYQIGYPILKHAVIPCSPDKARFKTTGKALIPCLKTIGEVHNRKKAFRPESIVNISAMSFGSLGQNAVSALNIGATNAPCLHNTGEGGVSPYHLNGAGLVWQLGTAYFGARDLEGNFSLDMLAQKVEKYPVKCIEIKLSQGAKPGKGGILPKEKITAEIAKIRNIPMGKDCVSPNHHNTFSTVKELIDFIELIATETGCPVGIKSAIGQVDFFKELVIEMKATSKGPDYIVIDGGEGGTGSAPLTFSDHVSLPFKVGFSRIYKLFLEEKMADRIVWGGSAKLGFPDRAITALAMGCDFINVAREAMMAIGCIQAQKCHENSCPTGVATQSKWLQAGLNIEAKSKRFELFIQGFRKELLTLSYAAGYDHPSQFNASDIEFSVGVNQFKTLKETLGYEKI